MSLGTYRPRNGGQDFQQELLALACKRARVQPHVSRDLHLRLDAWNPNTGATVRNPEAHCRLVHVSRGHWQAVGLFDGEEIAQGRSQLACIAAVVAGLK